MSTVETRLRAMILAAERAPGPADRILDGPNGTLPIITLFMVPTFAGIIERSLRDRYVDEQTIAHQRQLIRRYARYAGSVTIGIAGTLVIPPIVSVGLSLFSLSAPSLLSIGAFRGADMALGSSLFRSAFEPLFTPHHCQPETVLRVKLHLGQLHDDIPLEQDVLQIRQRIEGRSFSR